MQDINMQISQEEEGEKEPDLAKFQSEAVRESSEEQLLPAVQQPPDNRLEEEESKLATVQKEV